MKLNYLLISIIFIIYSTISVSCQSSEKISDQPINVEKIETLAASKFVNEDNYLIDDEPTSFFREQSLPEVFNHQVSFDHYINYAMRALALIAGFDNDLHRYDNKQDLINSFVRNHTLQNENLRTQPLPAVESKLFADQNESFLSENEQNQLECGNQLDMILLAASEIFSSPEEFSRSKQLSLIDYLDSFGAQEGQIMQGNLLWLGSHDQCFRAKLWSNMDRSKSNEEIGTRYCIANFRSTNWTTNNLNKDRLGGYSIKLGVCLPKSCNSISYFRHKTRIESLVKLVRLKQVPFSSYELVHLFCLPDESSPLRQFSLSARIFILLLSSWLTMLIYFSIKYEYQRIKRLSTSDNTPDQFDAKTDKLMRIFAFRLNWATLFMDSNSIKPKEENVQVFTLNTNGRDSPQTIVSKFDFDSHSDQGSDENSSLDQPSLKAANIIAALKNRSSSKNEGSENVLRVSLQHGNKVNTSSVVIVNGNQTQNQNSDTPTIDLSVIEGIKVLSMIWLIGGHTLLFFIRTIANGRDFWSILRDARFMTIMAGIFPVDTFFTITGILTAYLKFNKNDGEAMSKLRYWIEAFFHRYFRFMPMYLIIFWYTRDVSEYIGFGPLWDYATADSSLRSICKRESFSVPLLFQANFKPIDQHCVKPAWYLANDYQYLLLTPFFMGLIMKSTFLGYSVIGLSILISLILQFLTVFHSIDMDDFEAIINFKPMFGAYVLKNLWKLYVLPYNRIPPYLIGMMTGHMMYSLKKTRGENKQKGNITPNETADSSYSRTHNSTASLNTHHKSTTTIMSATSNPYSRNFLYQMSGLTNYLCMKIWTPLVFLISIIYLPMITRILTLEGLSAKIGTSSVIALMRFVWSVAIARLIYICATRFLEIKNSNRRDDSFVIRFLSSPKWKPWSKIGLSALLIQWEIISYLAQIQTSAPNMTISFMLAVVLLCIAATYSLALLIYLTVEYPLSQVEQLYLHPAIFCKK